MAISAPAARLYNIEQLLSMFGDTDGKRRDAALRKLSGDRGYFARASLGVSETL